MKRIGWPTMMACVLGLILFCACAEEKPDAPTGGNRLVQGMQELFPSSLHASRAGQATSYGAPDGFSSLTNLPIESLACKKCHAASYANGSPVDPANYQPGCGDCHVDPNHPTAQAVTDQVCLRCHDRQGVEQTLYQDVHRAAGKTCMDCHTKDEMHGNGTAYSSFLDAGRPGPKCPDCHTPLPANEFHNQHSQNIDCSACHVKSVSTCYNCHFESEVTAGQRRFFAQAPRTGFKMLMNFQGKVHAATFQTVSYDGKTFVTIAPFVGHSITKEGITCGDCHLHANRNSNGNPVVEEYKNTRQIVVTKWNPSASGGDRLVGPSGVIPIPPDWKTALVFDFLKYTGQPGDPIDATQNLPNWDYLKTGAEGSSIVGGTPLSEGQMYHLWWN